MVCNGVVSTVWMVSGEQFCYWDHWKITIASLRIYTEMQHSSRSNEAYSVDPQGNKASTKPASTLGEEH